MHNKLYLSFFLSLLFAFLVIGVFVVAYTKQKEVVPQNTVNVTVTKEPSPFLTTQPPETLPWQNSTCGNGICEKCESSAECCNYPPVKDNKGTIIYPPPTCIGLCASDCKALNQETTKQVTGVITSVLNGLAVDGNCSVFVGTTEIIITHSGERNPRMVPKEKGSITGISCKANEDLSNNVGKEIEGYGAWNGTYITVEGDKKYFILVK